MKILHVSFSQPVKHLGARNYLYPTRLNNGFIRNGHEVYYFSDRDVSRCSTVLGIRKLGHIAANRKFLTACANFRPDVIALCSADILTIDTIAATRRLLPNVAIFQYYVDPLFLEENLRNARSKREVVDHTFATTSGAILSELAGSRSRASFAPNPVDPSIDTQGCHLRADQPYDVFFAGHNRSHWLDPDDLRPRAKGLLAQHAPAARCRFVGDTPGEYLFGAEFVEAVGQAKIGLNFSQKHRDAQPGNGGALYMYSSDRIGIYQGNGLLVFSQKDFSLADLYGEEAVVEVADDQDFIEKIRYYLTNDAARRQTATRSHQLVHAEFNERLVSQYMIEQTMQLRFSHPYRWPTETLGV